jgi:hypothetical protein
LGKRPNGAKMGKSCKRDFIWAFRRTPSVRETFGHGRVTISMGLVQTKLQEQWDPIHHKSHQGLSRNQEKFGLGK